MFLASDGACQALQTESNEGFIIIIKLKKDDQAFLVEGSSYFVLILSFRQDAQAAQTNGNPYFVVQLLAEDQAFLKPTARRCHP